MALFAFTNSFLCLTSLDVSFFSLANSFESLANCFSELANSFESLSNCFSRGADHSVISVWKYHSRWRMVSSGTIVAVYFMVLYL